MAQQPPAEKKPEFKRLTALELKTLLDSRRKLFLLDVREPQELVEEGALPGAVNIPLGTLDKRWREIPKRVQVISICRRSHRAARAAELLQKQGYSRIQIFAMNDWKEKGYPVVHPPAPVKK